MNRFLKTALARFGACVECIADPNAADAPDVLHRPSHTGEEMDATDDVTIKGTPAIRLRGRLEGLLWKKSGVVLMIRPGFYKRRSPNNFMPVGFPNVVWRVPISAVLSLDPFRSPWGEKEEESDVN